MNQTPRLKDLREDADKTQQDIAMVLKTTQQQYWRYEAGERELKANQIKILAEYYHVSADYILGLPANLPYGKSITKPYRRRRDEPAYGLPSYQAKIAYLEPC